MKPLLHFIGVLLLLAFAPDLKAQNKAKPRSTATSSYFRVFNRYDTLRGKLTPLRSCYDVVFYKLAIRVNPKDSTIKGSNLIQYQTTADFQKLQIDLFKNMAIEKIVHHGKPLKFARDSNAVFVIFPETQKKGIIDSITVFYGGKPQVAKTPPWDGGFSWKKDKTGKPWIGVSCEGIGASLWWPNKDHLSDEPDSMYIRCEVPSELKCIANGNLKTTSYLKGGYSRYDWQISYPINNYNVTLNIGDYAQFTETYIAKDGQKMALDYYVMPYNLIKAKEHFKQVKPMLAIYEELFGKYPFWKDGYALVETSYLGMEHQSAIAYGNEYLTGYQGSDLSGVGLDFDYIIIHESAHEYWGNNVSAADHGEMWIHESFCTYAEALYVEKKYGYETALKYLQGQSKLIRNEEPILGPLDVNFEESSTTDMYFKGSNMLHTLRNVLDNDKLWFEILYGINQDFRFKQTNTEDLVAYISAKAGKDLTYFFDQYLKYPAPPTFTYKVTQLPRNKVEVQYKWTSDVNNFVMPIKVSFNGKPYTILTPTHQWQSVTLDGIAGEFKVATELFYVWLDSSGAKAQKK